MLVDTHTDTPTATLCTHAGGKVEIETEKKLSTLAARVVLWLDHSDTMCSKA